MNTSRRNFMAAAAAFAATRLTAHADRNATPNLQYGYAAITWGKEERQAIDDIAAVGYQGIQLRGDALTDFQPSQLRDILQQKKLTFVALSSGDVSLDGNEADQIAQHAAHAKYVKDAGGLYLQILDQLKSYPRTATPDECKRLGGLLTELGKRTADLGIPLGYP